VPRAAPSQPAQCQPAAPKQSKLGEGVDRILTARWHKPTGRQTQRRNHMAIRLDDDNQCSGRTPGVRGITGIHVDRAISLLARRRPERSCCSSRDDGASRLLGRARITMRSDGSNSASNARTACRSFLATRCRSTAPPTDLVTTKPICGESPGGEWIWRLACTTRSGCAARTPLRTAKPKSADRLIRLGAGSTTRDLCVRQSENRGPCGGGTTRSPDRRGCACAAEIREPSPAADCSAGRSVCPWPRRSLLVTSGGAAPGGAGAHPRTSKPHWFKLRKKRRGPGNRPLPCRLWLTTPRGYLGHLRRSNRDDRDGSFPICSRHVHRLAPVGKPVSFLPAQEVRISQQSDYLPPDK